MHLHIAVVPPLHAMQLRSLVRSIHTPARPPLPLLTTTKRPPCASAQDTARAPTAPPPPCCAPERRGQRGRPPASEQPPQERRARRRLRTPLRALGRRPSRPRPATGYVRTHQLSLTPPRPLRRQWLTTSHESVGARTCGFGRRGLSTSVAAAAAATGERTGAGAASLAASVVAARSLAAPIVAARSLAAPVVAAPPYLVLVLSRLRYSPLMSPFLVTCVVVRKPPLSSRHSSQPRHQPPPSLSDTHATGCTRRW
jgi:hypothetical protein